MRIHTHLDHDQITDIVHAVPGVQIVTDTLHASRTHPRAIELQLSGTSNRPMQTDARKKAATWDEWGMVLAGIFAADPQARVGGFTNPIYADAEDFAVLTGDRFASRPADLHAQHHWEADMTNDIGHGQRRSFHCTGCSAVQNFAQRTATR